MIYTAAMHQALVNELCSGRKLAETLEERREIESARMARESRGHKTIDGLGKLAGEIPQDTYFQIMRSLGPEALQDKSFLREFFKRHPHLKSHNI